MPMSFFRSTFVLSVVLALAACKAEKIEVRLDAATITSASSGASGEVDFEASVGEKYAEIDDEKRALISTLTAKIEKYFPGVEVDVDIGANEYDIEVKGKISVANAAPPTGAPWYVSASRSPDGEGILVQLLPSSNFSAFDAELKEVNFMLGPDEFQPVEFRFSAPSGTVIVGGVILDGRPVGISRITMSGQTLKMLFKGGIWEETSGSFLFVP